MTPRGNKLFDSLEEVKVTYDINVYAFFTSINANGQSTSTSSSGRTATPSCTAAPFSNDLQNRIPISPSGRIPSSGCCSRNVCNALAVRKYPYKSCHVIRFRIRMGWGEDKSG